MNCIILVELTSIFPFLFHTENCMSSSGYCIIWMFGSETASGVLWIDKGFAMEHFLLKSSMGKGNWARPSGHGELEPPCQRTHVYKSKIGNHEDLVCAGWKGSWITSWGLKPLLFLWLVFEFFNLIMSKFFDRMHCTPADTTS